MTGSPSLSVVVASHGRPRALRRCLLALSQSVLEGFEVVVVADRDGLEALAGLPCAEALKTVRQAEPNLARARNDGITQAAGEIVAFIDDDAVPEPTWAGRMAAVFEGRPALAAATGPVIGRNGISLQWGPMAVDRQGRDIRLADDEAVPPPDTVRKLHGTNMAVRRAVLEDLGGFDAAFRFYLDDTDLALRLAGRPVAWVPGAQVHHAFEASPRRTADRVPLDLHDVGASTAVFLRKHAPAETEDAIGRLAEDQRARLFRLARRRRLGARDMQRLSDSLREGLEEGRNRPAGIRAEFVDPPPFRRLRDGPVAVDEILAGWSFRAASLRAEAARLVAGGARVSLFLFEPSPRAHRVRFTDGGWWEQTGGLWGRSVRAAPPIQAWRFDSRLFSEIRRIGDTRHPQGFASTVQPKRTEP
jgi:GT2 family glycosyltransferase